jgi:hypothetical protein
MADTESDATASSRDELVNKDRFIRWQRLALDQLGFTLKFVLTLTIAALGYIFALLKDKEFVPLHFAKCFLILSLVFLAIAAICGMWCTINRLRDVQGTARRIRKTAGHHRVVNCELWVSGRGSCSTPNSGLSRWG